MTYANGALPANILVAVPGNPGLYLRPEAAASWLRLADAVLAKHGWRPTITDAYRSYDAQVRLFLERYRVQLVDSGPFGDVRWWQGRRYVRFTGAAAAVPGTSNHGLGETVDVRDMASFTAPRYVQFMTVAAEYGWSNAEGRSVKEPWHQHWFAAADRHVNDVVHVTPGGIDVPIITPPTLLEETDMPLTEPEYARLKGDMQATADSAVRALLVDPTILAGVASAVWARPVSRVEGVPSTILQDTVDGTTASLSTSAQIAGLTAAVQALATGQGVDPAAVTAAAEAGARKALAGLTLTAKTGA